jgi:lupus La protein
MFVFALGQKVGRVNPLLKPEDVQAAVDARSVAVGPLRWNVTMEELEIFFSQHAKVNDIFPSIYMCVCL